MAADAEEEELAGEEGIGFTGNGGGTPPPTLEECARGCLTTRDILCVKGEKTREAGGKKNNKNKQPTYNWQLLRA